MKARVLHTITKQQTFIIRKDGRPPATVRFHNGIGHTIEREGNQYNENKRDYFKQRTA